MPLGHDNASSPHAIALTVAYEGAPFAGFARQPRLDTVQGRIEAGLATALRRDVDTTGAGRTDSGVHARGQVVSFDARGDEPEPSRLRRSLDALTGEGVVVREVRLAEAGFSARFDAVSREYRYRIVGGPVPPLFLERYAWHVPGQLDVEAMRAAARLLVGEHDFRSFCVAESALGKRTVRRVELIEIAEEQHLGEACLAVRVVGNAFLHSMVRTIVGTLAEVGESRRDPDWVGAVLAAQKREVAGPTAPAHGLTLWNVTYSDDVWL
jgi:tRNA pseudouridine38-40 synthase